jgi:hypothetical protein
MRIRRPFVRVALVAAALLGVTAGVAFAVVQTPPAGVGNSPFTTAFYARDVNPKTVTPGNPATAAYVDLPAGSYVLNGKVILQNGSPAGQSIATCVLGGDSPSFVLQPNEEEAMPMLAAVTLAQPTRVSLTCSTESAAGRYFAYGASLVASQVDAVSGP